VIAKVDLLSEGEYKVNTALVVVDSGDVLNMQVCTVRKRTSSVHASSFSGRAAPISASILLHPGRPFRLRPTPKLNGPSQSR
jgi:hypothetical protein